MNAAEVATRLRKGKKAGHGWSACCPAHEDSTPSLSISDGESGRVVVHCHAGCSADSVLNALEEMGIELRKPKQNGHEDPLPPMTLADLSRAKGLAIQTLAENHLICDDGGIGFQYFDREGSLVGTKWRKSLGGGPGGKGFRWSRTNDQKPTLYGLWRIDKDFANDGRVILCEGETDSLTLWQFGYTALGIPGADMWREDWEKEIPAGAKVYVIIEPDNGGKKLEEKFRGSSFKKRVSFIRMTEAAKDPNQLHMTGEQFTESFDAMINAAEPVVAKRNRSLDWATLSLEPPPARQWAIDHWFGMGHVTLLAGAGGIGKTGVAQAMASCLVTNRDYLDSVKVPRRVLMWACEDDVHELHRRQLAIAKKIGEPLSAFKDFFLHSYDGEQVELAGLSDGRLVAGPMLEELNEQVGDYKADVIILDNIARLYGGNENDRHQVTSFMAMLTGVAKLTNAAVMLLGHPGKALGSEYSGSTAWEGAARARLYLGRTLPDKEQQEEPQQDDGIRYLARRKANYSNRDYRRIQYIDGCMVPDEPSESPRVSAPTGEFVQDIVSRAIRQLAGMGKFGNASTASPEYLPKLADQYKLMDGVSRSSFTATMREMEKAGSIKLWVVGKYQNRTPKMGYVITSTET